MFEGTQVDILLHVVTVLTASALFLVSFKAYRRKENGKFLYICLAFGVFSLKEFVLAANILMESSAVTAAVHLLNLLILALFFRGTLK